MDTEVCEGLTPSPLTSRGWEIQRPRLDLAAGIGDGLAFPGPSGHVAGSPVSSRKPGLLAPGAPQKSRGGDVTEQTLARGHPGRPPRGGEVSEASQWAENHGKRREYMSKVSRLRSFSRSVSTVPGPSGQSTGRCWSRRNGPARPCGVPRGPDKPGYCGGDRVPHTARRGPETDKWGLLTRHDRCERPLTREVGEGRCGARPNVGGAEASQGNAGPVKAGARGGMRLCLQMPVCPGWGASRPRAGPRGMVLDAGAILSPRI